MLDIITNLILYGLLIFMIVYFTKNVYSAIFLAVAAFLAITLCKKIFGKDN